MGFVIAVITYFGNKEIAELVGPYIAIAMVATMAAGWALSKVEEISPFRSVVFLCMRAGTAIVFSVTLAQALHLILSWAEPRYTALIFAAILGLVKDFDELKQYKDDFVAWIKGKPNA